MADILEWKSSHDIRYVEPITPLLIAEILDCTVQNLEKRGWSRGRLYADDGSMCVLGAIRQAVGGDSAIASDQWTQLALQRTVQAVTESVPSVAAWGALSFWNDSECADQAHAVATLLTVAAVMRAKEGQ